MFHKEKIIELLTKLNDDDDAHIPDYYYDLMNILKEKNNKYGYCLSCHKELSKYERLFCSICVVKHSIDIEKIRERIKNF